MLTKIFKNKITCLWDPNGNLQPGSTPALLSSIPLRNSSRLLSASPNSRATRGHELYNFKVASSEPLKSFYFVEWNVKTLSPNLPSHDYTLFVERPKEALSLNSGEGDGIYCIFWARKIKCWHFFGRCRMLLFVCHSLPLIHQSGDGNEANLVVCFCFHCIKSW